MNVILYVADALRADHLSCYGYERETSPRIDTFATEATKFDAAITPSTWTRSVCASILTGTYPSVHGVKTMSDYFEGPLPRLPGVLSSAGYETTGISAIGNVSSGLGFDKGFDVFVDLYKNDSLAETRETSSADKELLEHEEGTVVFPRGEDVVDRFLSETSLTTDTDVFSLLWTIDPHDPYDPPDEFETFVDPHYEGLIDGSRESLRRASSCDDFERLINLYDSEIRYTDWVFGELVTELKERDIYDETLLIFLGDHGEAFGDHDGNVGHSHVHYEELIHVPLIVKTPADHPDLPPTSDPVSLVDLFPTIGDLAGVDWESELPDWATGQSLRDGGREFAFTETQYSDVQNSFYSVRDSRWKYIKVETPSGSFRDYVELLTNVGFLTDLLSNPLYFFKRRFGDSGEHLYDLEQDPAETNNIATDRSELSAEYRETLDGLLDDLSSVSVGGRDNDATENIDDETKEQLREMGYLE